MSDARRTQEVVDQFLQTFLRPLLAGGTAHLGRAIAPAVLDAAALSASTDADSDEAILEALHETAAEYVPRPSLVWPDRGAVALALACHDLALLTDPMLDRVFARGARPKIAAFVHMLAEAAEPVRTRSSALVRHAVVSRFLTLARTDTVVRNWAYTYRFYGRPVPARVTAWKTLRRVKTEAQRRPLDAMLSALPPELDGPGLLRKIIAGSPVTQILLCDEESFRVDWSTGPVLSDPELRGGLVRALLAADAARAAASVGAALLVMSASLRGGASSEPALIRTALIFAFELQATALLGRGAPVQVGPPDAPTAAVAAFAALLGTAEGAELAGVRLIDPDDLRVLRNAAIDARRRVGDAAFQAAHTLVLASAAKDPARSAARTLPTAPEAFP